jgi:regulator of protease activity HflC (stomatin/prohibitin superfamily)
MRWRTGRNPAAGKGSPDPTTLVLEVDCTAKEHIPAHVKVAVSFGIGGDPEATGPAPRVKGAPDDMSALVRDIFVRLLPSVVENFTWQETITMRPQLIEQTRAACGPEMDGLGLRIDSLQFRGLDFPEGSEPTIALRAAAASVRRESQAARVSADAASEFDAAPEVEAKDRGAESADSEA